MRLAAVLLVASALLAGCNGGPPATPTPQEVGRASAGGGSVLDDPGYFASFSADATQGDVGGSSVVTISGSVQDNNSETDIAWIRGALNGSAPLYVNHSVTTAERGAFTEPAAFGADGFKVWTGASDVDGLLLFRWRLVVPAGTAPGLYALVASEGNPGAPAWSAELPLTLQKASEVTVAPQPVNWTGVSQNASWGAWNATPGATSVVAANYLKITNTGQLARPRVVLDFNELAFTGATDAGYMVPINGNVDFAWWEDATPNATSPSEGTYAWSTSADGSLSFQFGAVGDVIYVTYRVKALPAVLRDQAYAATFTLTDAGGDDGGAALPDLVVDSLSTPTGAVAGSPVAFTAVVRNIGLGAANASSIPVQMTLDGGTFNATYSVQGPLAPGARANVTSASWNATKGAHSLAARVDPLNATAESSETDNVLTQAFSVAAGVADPGFAYEDVACDTLYETGVDVAISASAVRDGTYDARSNCLVIPPSVGDISTSKAISYKSTVGVTVLVNITSTNNALTLDAGAGFVQASGVALASKGLLTLKSTGGSIDARSANVTSSTDAVSVTTAGAGTVNLTGARASAAKQVTLKAAGAALGAAASNLTGAQGVALTSRGTLDLRGAVLTASGASSVTLSTTISAQQVLVDAAEFHDAANVATLSPAGDVVVGTPAFGAVV